VIRESPRESATLRFGISSTVKSSVSHLVRRGADFTLLENETALQFI
jgi:hypothetical protein